MHYKSFTIQKYRAIESPIIINLAEQSLVPLIGVNECGKTTILQAIFAFDYINDNENDGRHLKTTDNLYHTQDSQPLITAEIGLFYSDLSKHWNFSLKEWLEKSDLRKNKIDDEDAEKKRIRPSKDDSLPIPEKMFKGSIKIIRNLKSKTYSVAELRNFHPEFQDIFSRSILGYMPYILYNDDFQDRPPSTLDIPAVKPESLSGWLAIYERLFEVTNSSYSLFGTADLEDSRRKDSIVSDVQSTLNDTLANTWKTFLLDRNRTIAVRLSLTKRENGSVFKIHIIENIGKKERFFEVADRSKGFLWFFNFVMKLEFNPKVTGNHEETVYLLDEPGSYLHSAAQEKLCAKLKAISKKHGKVIFCTHSHRLLDPEQIPLNSIRIVTKSRQKEISITSLSRYKTSGEKITALQPVFEALQISQEEFLSSDDKPILAMEGIYDKYAVKLFLPGVESFRILPGTSADSIIKNIQLLNAFGKIYIAIWDNDSEGRKVKTKASSTFGPFEADRFDLLPSREGAKDRRMEQMFNQSDLALFRTELGLSNDATYEGILGTLFYSPTVVKKKLFAKVSLETKNNFKVLQKIVEKRFEASLRLREAE